MHATHYLSQCQIKRAQTTLARRRFTASARALRVDKLRFGDTARLRAATRMPRRVHQRALLRNQQQEYAKLMEKPARHYLSVFSLD